MSSALEDSPESEGDRFRCARRNFLFIIYLSLHGLVAISFLGHVTTYLSVTLASPYSIHTSLTISPVAGVILPLGLGGLCLLGVSLVGILLVRT